MAENRSDRDEDDLPSLRGGEESLSEKHWHEAFQDIENEHHNPRPFAKDAKDIGRADIAAPVVSDVEAT